VLTTYRLTEHHTAGDDSHTFAPGKLQPELFMRCLRSWRKTPGLSTERGYDHFAARHSGSKSMVTRRMHSLWWTEGACTGRTSLSLGLSRRVKGDVVNDLVAISEEPTYALWKARRWYATSYLDGELLVRGARTIGSEYGAGMSRTAFLTDSTLCIGCKACEVACKEWNGIGEDG